MSDPAEPPAVAILILGRDTCSDTTRSRIHLQARGIGFRYLKVDEDPDAEAWIRRLNEGLQVTPTILIGNPEDPDMTLREPSNDELDAAIEAVAGR
jgi:glutaredoxin